MSQKKADLLLASIAMVWGSSNLLLKIGAADMGTFNLIALRFCIAFVVTAAVFHRQLRHPDKKALAYGAALGAIIFAIFVALVAAKLLLPGKPPRLYRRFRRSLSPRLHRRQLLFQHPLDDRRKEGKDREQPHELQQRHIGGIGPQLLRQQRHIREPAR